METEDLASMHLAEASDVTGRELELPSEVLYVILGNLTSSDVARTLCVCKTWQKVGTAPQLWERFVNARWRHGQQSHEWEQLQRSGRWHELFLARTQVDAEASECLRQLQWPSRWHPGIKQLHRLGFNNCKDLIVDRIGSDSVACGPKYWARVAAEDLVGRQAADDLAQLLAAHEGRHLDEGALLVASVHHPLADLSWVRSALDALGAELRRRLAEAGVAGGVPALEILSALLFGATPPVSHTGFAAIPPPAGYGMGLQGNRESYYDPANSLLSEVLVNREGIPISLAVIHAAVAARAGLEVRVLNVPMHVVTHYGAQDSDEERFIDVFDQGRIMTREGMGGLLSDLGMLGFDRRHLQPMAPAKVYARMCFNLASIYSALGSNGDMEALKLQKSIMRLLVAEDHSDTFNSRLELAKACAALYQYDEALELLQCITNEVVGGGPAPQGSPSNARNLLEAHIGRLRGAIEEQSRDEARVKRRKGSSTGVRYEVGQIIRHRRYEYRGVIIGWDPTCAASEDWMVQMGVDRLERGRHQPFYTVLVDPQDRGGQQTYVAEENVGLEALPRRQRYPGFEVHPEVGRYFERLRADGTGYVPNEYMRERYPDD